MFSPCLLMIHDSRRGCEDDEPELAGGEEFDDPFLEIGDADVVAGGDNACFIDSGKRDADN